MGLLSLGTPLDWEEAKKHAVHVRQHGIVQFLNIWNRIKTRRKDRLLWGDEVEYIVVEMDEKKASLSLSAHDALLRLEKLEHDQLDNGVVPESSWKPEYGRYMLEGTPGVPYGGKLDDLVKVEENMMMRRQLAQSMLHPNERLVTMTNFPHLGVHECFGKQAHPPNPLEGASQSLFITDVAINPHARFGTLTANIRKRRDAKVVINVPVFKDKNTPSPFKEPLPHSLQGLSDEQIQQVRRWSDAQGQLSDKDPLTEKTPYLQDIIPDAKDDHIYMDAMCFGMGCCCLQITFQACSVEEARKLYDHLAVLSPIMLALSAASPIFKGYLADVDCRWNIIAASVDDRNQEERGIKPLKDSQFKIPKSRYDSISTYLSPGPVVSGGCCGHNVDSDGTDPVTGKIYGDYYKDKYNDIDLVYDKEIYEKLVAEDVDHLLAKHYAHLFIRDPLVIFRELLDQDDQASSDHFENIQSTNWQTMRFKPPPPTAPNIGWRVEFRSMEAQRTDFENAAFAIFIVLMTRAILSFSVNLYIPLSKVILHLLSAPHIQRLLTLY